MGLSGLSSRVGTREILRPAVSGPREECVHGRTML